jgi:hypothetical protein
MSYERASNVMDWSKGEVVRAESVANVTAAIWRVRRFRRGRDAIEETSS